MIFLCKQDFLVFLNAVAHILCIICHLAPGGALEKHDWQPPVSTAGLLAILYSAAQQQPLH